MPLYEFKCPKCEKTVDVLQKYDDPNPTCDCGESDVEMKRVYSVANPIFKGSGFYETDYKKKGE